MLSSTRLAEVFVQLADTLVVDFDLVEFLHGLTGHVADLSGTGAVGLLLADHRGALQFMAASSSACRTLELTQLELDEGPCRDCYLSAEPVVNADLAHASDRWPRFAPQARDAGFEWVHAFPMRLREEAIGALNLFGVAGGDVLTAADAAVVQALADVATIAILQERSISRAENVTDQLQRALDSRVVVEQAKGVLAQREGIGVDEAFEVLRRRARSERRRVADLAQEIVHPG